MENTRAFSCTIESLHHPDRHIDVIVRQRRSVDEYDGDEHDVFVDAVSELPRQSPKSIHRQCQCLTHEEDHLIVRDDFLDNQGRVCALFRTLERSEQEDDIGIVGDINMCFPSFTNAHVTAGSFVKRYAHIAQLVTRFWAFGVKLRQFQTLPDWMQDNEFLHRGHRPPMNNFGHCFRSVFQVHTETGNIWTHILGCVAFIGIASWFLSRDSAYVQWQDKLVFSAFFFGVIMCMGLSSLFHTVQCHSRNAQKLFSKLDYAGICLLMVGSFIPWLYYGFYCRPVLMFVYMGIITFMGGGCVCASLMDRFAEPAYRPIRAGLFVAMGLSALIPTGHYWYTDGFMSLLHEASLVWMSSMGVIYILGAAFYAFRIPERFFPGQCDIWFQSHQIFHCMVILAALVHYHGINVMAEFRLQMGTCSQQLASKWQEIYGHLVEFTP